MITPCRKRTFAIFILFFVLIIAEQSLASRLPVKIYTSADGLGSGFVDYIMRDSRGFMWFCTRDGLSRFDGSRFVTYQVGDGESAPGVEGIFEAKNGVYWITTTGGTYRFDPNATPKPEAGTNKLKADFVTDRRGSFFEDLEGNLYYNANGLYLVDQTEGKITEKQLEIELPENPNVGFFITDISETGDGSLWLSTSWGVVRRMPTGKIVYFPVDTTISSGFASMITDRTGRIWFTVGNRLVVMKPEPIEAFADAPQVTVKQIEPSISIDLKPEENYTLPKKSGDVFQFSSLDVNEFVENSYAKRITQTSDGNVWVTAENYLMQFADGVFHLHTEAEGLPNVMARMAEDAAGNLWIGGHAGLARLDRQGLVTYGTSDGANSLVFFAITEDPDGSLYFAGRDFYINRFDGKRLLAVRPQIDANSQFLWTSRFAFRASSGDWWVLTNNKLYRFSGVTDFPQLNGRKASATYTTNEGLKSNGIFQIFEDSVGDIWVSTRDINPAKYGLSRLRKGASRFETFTASDGFPDERSVSSFAEDGSGNIWMGFYEGGLLRFDGEKFYQVGYNENLPNGVLTDMLVDAKGRLWISSALSGLLRLDDTNAKKPVFVRMTTKDGLMSNNIRTITEDRFGRIYTGSASGVDRISPDTGRVKHYSVNDGLAADFIVDSRCDKQGNLWFASSGGMSRLVPLPDEKATPPRVFLGGVRIAGVEQPISELGNTIFDRNDLSHSENNLQIEFFGLDLRAGESLRYQFKLEGADADWSEPTDLRTVTYANLQPATYRFVVRAVNSDGVTSETPAIVSFRILSPVWERWWFIVLSVLLIATIIVMFYRYRTARLREINVALSEAKRAEESLGRSREERLAELERVRSRIATDLHDDIGASLTQIAVLSEVAQAQGKKANAASAGPLTRISQVSNELVGTMSDIVWSINPAKDHLSDLTQRMRRFAADVLTSRSIKFHFHGNEENSGTIVNSNLRREAFLIFKESINNIVKHAEAENVWTEINIAHSKLRLTIRDDGKGFDPGDEMIAEKGNGLASMKRRTLEIGGSFEVRSEPGHATEIIASIPIESISMTVS